MTQVKCPRCDGKGHQIVTGIKYAPGHRGPLSRDLPCSQCGGQGTVDRQMINWITHGRRIREYRTERLRMGLRNAAKMWHMKASELSAIEQGKVNNLSFFPHGFPSNSSKEMENRP